MNNLWSINGNSCIKAERMKRILLSTMAFALAIAAQGQVETVDTAQFVAVYDYECRTLDDEDAPVTDRMQVVVQVGRTVTKSMPASCYRLTDEKSIADLRAEHQEAILHMPTVWTGWPEGQTTVREFIFPHEFEGHEPTPDIAWMLTEDTVTVSGYHCQQATTTFRGVEWHVCYTEDVPSSAGPWRLRGLPGLIVKAVGKQVQSDARISSAEREQARTEFKAESEAHTFCLAELRMEASPITYERKPDVQRIAYDKLLKHRNEVYGHKRYGKNPTYYIPDLQGSISHMEVYKNDGQPFIFANGQPLLTKAHVYQPLEQ